LPDAPCYQILRVWRTCALRAQHPDTLRKQVVLVICVVLNKASKFSVQADGTGGELVWPDGIS